MAWFKELEMGEYKEYLADSRSGLGISYRFDFPNGKGLYVYCYDDRRLEHTSRWDVKRTTHKVGIPGDWNWAPGNEIKPFKTNLTDAEVRDLLEEAKNLE